MIVLLGLGRETSTFLRVADQRRLTTEVVVLDERPREVDELPWLAHVDVRIGTVDLDDADALAEHAHAELVLRSPGISPYRPALATARERGIPITTPTGWWTSSRAGDDVIAITGTKGKSTTASLVAGVLAAAGRRVALCGNIGTSVLERDLDDAPEVDDVVVELSSYQLADLEGRVALGAVTTLLRDHVPWHGSVERYHADKLRLLDLADRVIAPGGLDLDAWRSDAPAAVPSGALRREIATVLHTAGRLGEHVVADAELALAIADARLQRPGGLAELIPALGTVPSLPHRLEDLGRRRGVRFVDDSISTVPESTIAAVRAYREQGPVTVLLGGDDRGQQLDGLVALLDDHDVRAVLLPPLADRLATALSDHLDDRVASVEDLPAAVEAAVAVTPSGGTVILSPAAASHSRYRDFTERGAHFAALVTALGDERDVAPGAC